MADKKTFPTALVIGFASVGIVFIVVLFLFLSKTTTNSTNKSEKYFSDYHDLRVEGRVTGTNYIDKGFGLTYLKMIRSNVAEHDVRGNTENYLLILKDSLADVCYYSPEIRIDDSLVIDFPTRKITDYRNGIIILSRELNSVGSTQFFISEISKKQRF